MHLANTFQSKAFPGTNGLVTVRTEHWNSNDGITHRAQKSQAWGGILHD